MIKSLTITNYLGESIHITLTETDPDHGLMVQSITGLGPPKADINLTNLATNDGSLFNSARANERNIVIDFLFGFSPRVEDARQRTYKYMPIKQELTFLVEADNRIAYTTGYVESNTPDIFSKNESNSVSIICPDPYFYSQYLNETVFSGIVPLFEFEFSNESLEEPLLEMGSIEIEKEKTVYYDGEAEVGVVITIHALGEVRNITIYNTGTREYMRIDTDKLAKITGQGKGMITGDDIIINTIRGKKSIQLLRGGHYRNILNCLDRDSDWFHLTKGDNIFAYIADYGEEDIYFKIENRIAYEGI